MANDRVERNKEIEELVRQQFTYNDIAEKLKISRYVVVGVVTRAITAGRLEKPFRQKYSRKVSAVKPPPPPKPVQIIGGVKVPYIAPAPLPLLCEPVSLFKVRRNQCRWPIEPVSALQFCGMPTRAGYSFCECHAEIAYVPYLRRA
jgi:hypothetical protein